MALHGKRYRQVRGSIDRVASAAFITSAKALP